MSKETVITCDVCKKRILEKRYATLTIRKIKYSNIDRYPSMYVCPLCFNYIGKPLSLNDFHIDEEDTND